MLPGAISNPIGCLVCAAGVAHLYSHVSKPLLDASLITFSLFRLSRAQQSNASAGIFGYQQVAFVLLYEQNDGCVQELSPHVYKFFLQILFVYSNKQELNQLILIKAKHRRTYQYFILSKKITDSNKSSVLKFSF
jgi:hypothetical protein